MSAECLLNQYNQNIRGIAHGCMINSRSAQPAIGVFFGTCSEEFPNFSSQARRSSYILVYWRRHHLAQSPHGGVDSVTTHSARSGCSSGRGHIPIFTKLIVQHCQGRLISEPEVSIRENAWFRRYRKNTQPAISRPLRGCRDWVIQRVHNPWPETDPNPDYKGAGPTEGQDYFEVGGFLSYRARGTEREFLTRWMGYGPLDDSWQPEANFDGTTNLLGKYLRHFWLEARSVVPRVGSTGETDRTHWVEFDRVMRRI